MESEQQDLEAELKSLRVQLGRKQLALRKLKEQRSGYGLRAPVDLEIELDNTEAEVARLRETVTEVKAKAALAGLPQSDRVEVPNNLPFADKREAFVGREADLEALHGLLQGSGTIAICTGMGGVGKTELALQYARRHLAEYRGGVCWLFVRGREAGSQIVEFARSHFQGTELPEGVPVLEVVRACYRQWPGGPVLLVLDDVVDWPAAREFLPSEERFKVLLTSREKLLQREQRLDLEILKPLAALRLLKAIAGRERLVPEARVARELCRWLGYLPLGVQLAGWYLADCEDLAIAVYLQRLRERGLGSRSLREVPPEVRARYGVAEAFELSWERLSGKAQRLGVVLSMFAQAPIAWEMVAQVLGEDADPEDVECWRDLELVRGHLLERVGSEVVRLHPLVREFLRGKWETVEDLGALQRAVAKAIVVAGRVIEYPPTVQMVEAVAPVVPHLQEVATVGVEWLSDEDLGDSFNWLAWFHEGQVDYEQAELWKKRRCSVVRERLGSEHETYAESLNNLANLYQAQGKNEEAEPLYQEAIAIARRTLSPDHPQLATRLNNLAILYRAQGKNEEAEPLYLEAIAIDRRTLSPDHPDLAIHLNNLANLYQDQGKNEDAEPLYLEAIAIDRRALSPDHPSLAIHLNNLALLYRNQGKNEDAEPLFLEAIAIDRRTLSPDHPSLAIDLNNLANLYRAQGKYEDAEPLYLEALAIDRRTLSPDHPQLATHLNNLANLYRDQGKYEEAEPLFLEAVSIFRKSLPADHPNLGIVIGNFGKMYSDAGKYAEAEPLLIEALGIWERSLPPGHDRTKKVRGWLEELRERMQGEA